MIIWWRYCHVGMWCMRILEWWLWWCMWTMLGSTWCKQLHGLVRRSM